MKTAFKIMAYCLIMLLCIVMGYIQLGALDKRVATIEDELSRLEPIIYEGEDENYCLFGFTYSKEDLANEVGSHLGKARGDL